jgi:hypothetical protein
MPNLGGIGRELKAQRDRAQKEVERLNAAPTALGQPGKWERKIEASSGRQKTKTHVGGRSQKNRRSAAGTLGKVEEEQSRISKPKERLILVRSSYRAIGTDREDVAGKNFI